MNRPPDRAIRIRWWPAAIIVVGFLLALAWVWLTDGGRDGQDRVMLTIPILIVTVFLLGVWLVFLSRLPRRRRIVAAGLVLASLAAAAATLRVRGVTGDLVPIVEWRWATRVPPPMAPAPLPEPASPSSPTSATPATPAVTPAPETTPSAVPSPAAPTVAAAAAPAIPGADYPQFLGPTRDGVVTSGAFDGDWSTRPPRLVWRRPVGAGWSGFAIASNIAVTQEQRGGREMVVAYDLATGAPKWSHADETHYQSTIAGEGPRATPTIAGGRVYALGSTGVLNCLDLATGRRIWKRDIAADNESPQPEWGRSSSPLVVDDLVIVSAGGSPGHSLVAYRRESGEPAWHAGDDAVSYSSPVVATLAGVRQIVVLNQPTVVGHDPATGRVLWAHEWPRSAPSAAIPLLVADSRVLVSSGYGMGSRLLQISRDGETLTASLVWESPRLKAKFTNPVVHNGFVYGLDDGVLVCVDLATGERRWKAGRYGHGQTLLVGTRLLVQTEDGDLVLVEPTPDAHREIGRFTAFSQKTWNPPAVAGRYLLVRTDAEAALYELGGQ